ncbi:dihydrolipoamide acetyltransferase family protein [Curtobacterium sp. 22159]|uniref:dihydrolipoamide acetyltransferase family protein n=1 Tax=Curtobacterium sp. 22159 TaxID=3453882 RepID=UPI003F84C59F
MIDILMPRLSDTMTEGAIAAWRKQPGEAVRPGDVLVEIETDKALMEQEAYDAGVLAEILVAEGENVAIGTPIARLDDGTPASDSPTEPPASEPGPPEQRVPGDPAASISRSDRRAASPLVRRIAKERGIDLATVTGSGPGGRVVRADLDAVDARETSARPETPAAQPSQASAGPSGSDDRESRRVPFDAIRRSIASRLTAAVGAVPTFTATASADIEELLALRATMNERRGEDGRKLSLNDFLVRASALALRLHPGINASYAADGSGATLLHDRVHVGIAVASPAGLVVPVVRDADRMSVATVAAASRELVSRASARTLTNRDMDGGTFTVSNLGMYGVEHFTAIINPPQGAILAVGSTRQELALIEGTVTSRARLTYTLTADHRIIDGALAASFLRTFTELLENPWRVIA